MTLFGIKLEPSSGQQDTDITLEGQDPVLPGAANMTFIGLEGALKTHLLKMPNPFGFLGHWNDAKVALISPLGPNDPNGPTGFYNPR